MIDSPQKASAPSLEEVYQIIQAGAEKTLNKYSPLKREHEVLDVANAYFADYVEKGFHEKFDPKRGIPLSAWVGLGLKRWAVDRLRDKRFQFQQGDETVFRTISGDQVGESNLSILQVVSESVASKGASPLSEMIVEEALSTLDPTAQQAVRYRMENYNMREIAELMHTTRSRVSRTLEKVREELAYIL